MKIAAILTGTQAHNRLDIETLLAHVLQVSRAYLLAFSDRVLTAQEQIIINNLLAEYEKGVPVAYLTGHREFWSLDFIVTPATLIPRPETELLIELTLEKITGKNNKIADLGVGSGAIALAIAHERPTWEVHATDASVDALNVARLNAQRFNLKNVFLHHGNWCRALPAEKFNLIVSNPPYIAPGDPHLTIGALRFEPHSALVAAEHGLRDLRIIIEEATQYLVNGGYLMLEHGFEQAAAVRKLLAAHDYQAIETHPDLAKLDRVTIARL